MTSRQSTATAAYPHYDGDGYLPDELTAGDRLGPPLPNPRRRSAARLGVAALSLAGCWWIAQDEQASLRLWVMTHSAAVYEMGNRAMQSQPSSSNPAAAIPALPILSANTSVSTSAILPTTSDNMKAPPEALLDAKVEPTQEAAVVPPTADLEAAKPTRLPPPEVDPADTLQVRAVAVGLHPNLSRVLLSRLSAVDYRNAGVAIKTAVAETPDDEVHIWPRERTPERALFRVHFVHGTVAECRRYVVSVIKDGWLTTALPMEKCGVQAVRAKRN